MRILFASLTPYPRIGGQTTFLAQMSREMTDKGHEVNVASPSQFPGFWMTFADRVSALLRAVTGSWLWFFLRLRLMAMFLRFYMLARGLWDRIDVIDAQDPPSLLALSRAARKRGMPLIMMLHGYYHFESNLGSIPPDSFWMRRLMRLERRAYMAASEIVAVDTRLRDYVIRLGLAPEEVSVRFNSVDSDLFRPVELGGRAVARQYIGVSPEVKIICCARRLMEKAPHGEMRSRIRSQGD